MAVAAIIQGYITLLRTHWGTTLIFLLVARSLYRRYCTPLRHVPGPFLASITTLWLLSVQYSPRQHHIYVELHQKYGPVVRISPYRVIFACPDSINEYFGWNKSKWWKALWPNPTVKNHGGVLEVTAHKAAKAKVMGAYNMSYLIKSEGKVDGHIIAFMDKLAGKLGQPFDFAPYGQFFAFDVIMDVAAWYVTKPMNFIKNACDVNGQIRSLHQLLFFAEVFALYSWVSDLLNHRFWYPLFSPKRTAKRGPGAMLGLAHDALNERLRNPDPTSTDMIQWLIDHKNQDGIALSLPVIEQEILPPILAGSDSTASTFRSMLLRISTNPRVYNKLISQINAADAAGLLSTPVARYDEVMKHVPYLDACRKEALRLLPAGAAPFFRECPPQGARIGGYFIPGGTEVGLVQWAIGRSTEFYGEDANLFRPERWMDEKDEHRKRLRDLGDVYFSSGVFACSGKNLALMELMKAPLEIYRRFEVEVVNTAKPWEEIGSLAVIHRDFWIKLSERKREETGAPGGVESE